MPDPKPAVDPPTDLHKLQFEYAWKWFSFHADQRTKVFNFMLILVGILAAGTINALECDSLGLNRLGIPKSERF